MLVNDYKYEALEKNLGKDFIMKEKGN